MSDYGLSLVLGCPFSPRFGQWVHSEVAALLDGPIAPDCLHATVINCTRPSGRSQQAALGVLAQVKFLEQIWLDNLAPIIAAGLPFELPFQAPVAVGKSLILPSLPHPSVGDLITCLQGGRAWIGEDEVSELLQAGAAIGANKFATERRQPTESVSVTLGRTRDGVPRSPPANGPPAEKIEGLRIVYYRDRRLVDASVSDELRFGSDIESVKRAIRSFCSSVHVDGSSQSHEYSQNS